MADSIYVVATEPYSGKSVISLALVDFLLRKTSRVAVFRPIIRSIEKKDKNIDLLLSYFNLNQTYEETFAYTMRQATDLLGRGKYDEIVDTIFQKFKALENRYDFIVCIGSDFLGEGAAFEFDMNATVAHNLGTPILLLSSANSRTVDEVVSAVEVSLDSFVHEHDCQTLGVIVNRAAPDKIDELYHALTTQLDHDTEVLAVMPENDLLDQPTIREIADALNAEILYGVNQLHRHARSYLIAAMQLQHYLPHVSEDALVITPGDRVDVILGTLQAHRSRNYPQVSGILLTGGMKPDESMSNLLDGLNGLVPILSVEADTFQTAAQVGAIHSYMTRDNHAKIDASLNLFRRHINQAALEKQMATIKPRGLTPKMFLYNLIQKAKFNKKHIVLPEGNDERILRAADKLIADGVVDLTILGHKNRIIDDIQRLGLKLDPNKIQILLPEQAPKYEKYAETLYELRKHRYLTLEGAQDLMRDVSYFGTMMVHLGDADGMVSGAVHTTQHTIRPALQFVKTRDGYSIVSSVFFMCLDDRVLVYGDCAINPNPTAEELAEIAMASSDSAQAFGIEPRVAMLSYSSGESGKGEDVDKVRGATEIVKAKRPDILIEGPIQYDAAVDPSVAAKKLPDSPVAGKATVLIFPDLNTGNNTYKAVQRETGALAVGPLLQGLNKPVNDLSRGATVDDIVNTVAMTAIQAEEGI